MLAEASPARAPSAKIDVLIVDKVYTDLGQLVFNIKNVFDKRGLFVKRFVLRTRLVRQTRPSNRSRRRDPGTAAQRACSRRARTLSPSASVECLVLMMVMFEIHVVLLPADPR